METKKIIAMLGVFLFAIFLGRSFHADTAYPGDYFEVFTSYHNTGSKVENMKVTLYMPDLGVYYRSNTFNLATRDNGGRYLLPYIPEDAPTGWTRMWLMLSNSEGERDYHFDWVYVG